MKAINTQIDFVLNDLRQAITDANKEPRQYNKKSAYQYTPEQSRFKLVVWFHDGNRRTYYSFDNVYYNKVAHIDEQEAVMKLIRLTANLRTRKFMQPWIRIVKKLVITITWYIGLNGTAKLRQTMR
jgi:hypothetical protein